MVVITKFLEFRTKGENDIKNITEDVRNALNETNLENGIILSLPLVQQVQLQQLNMKKDY